MKGGVPLYHMLKSELLDQIGRGEWEDGKPLPSEPELAERFGVSRTTVRQALADLVSAGYIVRQQGKGTFVAKRAKTVTASSLYGFAEEIRNRGLTVDVRVEKVAVEACPADVAQQLKVEPNTPVVHIVRHANLEAIPLFVEKSYLLLPYGVRDDAVREHPEWFDQIYGFFEHNGVRIALGRQTIKAAIADEVDQATLGVEIGEAVLVIIRVTQDDRGEPVEFSEVHYRGDQYAYEVNLVRGID